MRNAWVMKLRGRVRIRTKRKRVLLLNTWPGVLFLVKFNNQVIASIGVTCSYLSRPMHIFTILPRLKCWCSVRDKVRVHFEIHHICLFVCLCLFVFVCVCLCLCLFVCVCLFVCLFMIINVSSNLIVSMTTTPDTPMKKWYWNMPGGHWKETRK